MTVNTVAIPGLIQRYPGGRSHDSKTCGEVRWPCLRNSTKDVGMRARQYADDTFSSLLSDVG